MSVGVDTSIVTSTRLRITVQWRRVTVTAKRYLVIAAAAVAMTLSFSSPAAAGGGGQGGSNDDGTAFILARAGGRDFTPGGHGSGCTYDVSANEWPLAYDQLNRMIDAGPIPDDLGTQLDSRGRHFWTGTYEGVEHWYAYQDCPGGSVLVWLPVVAGPNLGNWAYNELLRKIPRPDPFFDPMDNGGQWLYTQVPTDYRVRNLRSYYAEASAFGATVRATATPREVVFELNDAGRLVDSSGAVVSEVACPALGSIAPYDPASPGPCSMTFLDSSSISGDADFDYVVRVEWDVTFTAFGFAGPLPAPTTVTTFTIGESVRVGEARPSA